MSVQLQEACNAVEGYAIETSGGLIFTVKGLIHPPDRLVAFLRYLPDLRGDRRRKDTSYRRVYRFEEQRKILLGRFPGYLTRDPAFGIELQEVPLQDVRQVYDPCLKFAEMRDRDTEDPLERSALAFAELLQVESGVPPESIGISGSLLIGLHRPESDLDLVVYGERECLAVHTALLRLLAEPSGPVRRLDGDDLVALHAAHRADTPLPLADFSRLQSRKVNEGRFEGLPYFIRFVKRREEFGERYGIPCFEPLGRAAVECTVTDHRDGIFTPCLYKVEDVAYLDCVSNTEVRELVSFRGRFSDQARAGERVIAKGRLERVTSPNGEVRHRLTVGGEPGDYLLSRAPDRSM